MDHDVLRFLLFSAQQQHQQGAGLTAQLHALRLKCAAQAEQSQAAGQDQALFSDLSEECSRLLLATTGAATGQAADARWEGSRSHHAATCTSTPPPMSQLACLLLCRAARCAAATSALAGGLPLQFPQGGNLVSGATGWQY